MKCRTLVFAIIAMLLMVPGVSAGRPFYNTDIPVLSAVAESITPYPVEPGLDFTVQLRVYNDGGERAENVSITFIESDAFFLTGKDDDFDNPFSLCISGSKDNIYYFTVLPDVKSGEYPLIFKIKEQNVVHEEKVFVRVIGEPDIIFNANLLNDSIAPKGSFSVELIIKNVGTGIARNIKIVPQTRGFVMEGSNLIFINELKPENSIKKEVQFMVSDSNSPGPQKLSFAFTYKDEKSNDYSLEQSLGVKLLNKVKLDIAAVIVDPQPIIQGENTIVTVRIENLGEGKAENVQVFLKNDGFEGQNKAYIGKLSEDEDAPAVFTLISSKPGKHDFIVKVTYEDDTGRHELTETLELLVLEKNNVWLWVLIAIIAIIVGFIGFMFFKKKYKK
ncbi:MAG: COG1361 S-layer family protein [Candidatus Aenigmarchaeota archaeon]|nr:COG1361 S-layer family protein [Candidatus Aenigmarchaeota archaeon]